MLNQLGEGAAAAATPLLNVHENPCKFTDCQSAVSVKQETTEKEGTTQDPQQNQHENTCELDDCQDAIEEQESIEQDDAESTNIGLFRVQSASKCLEEASKLPIPKMLFSELWFEDEICILFASANVGKSILAVQIADSISRGVSIKGFELEAQAQPVLYFDFEMSKKQFENRCSENYTNHYSFHDNFKRVEINPDAKPPQGMTFERYLNQSIVDTVKHTSAKILIIDNITYMNRGTETAKDALPLMKLLKRMKAKFGLSILALAHTPKKDASKPITKNDLQGSSMLMNFCDSSFAIAESTKGEQMRYIKQIKVRSCEMVYGSENVAVCEIVKPHNFVHFEFVENGAESDHLKPRTKKDKTKLIAEAKQLHSEGKSFRKIGELLGMSKNTAEKYAKS